MNESGEPGFFATQIAQNNNEQDQETVKENKDEAPPSPPKQQKIDKPLTSMKSLLLAFNSCDTEQTGMIAVASAKQILHNNKISTDKFDLYYQVCQPMTPNFITFDEFLFVTCLSEDESVEIQRKYELMCGKIDSRLVEFLRLLNNYRKKTQNKHDYKEAKKSKAKIQQIRERQLERRKNYLNILHHHEIEILQEKQRAHFNDFCENWDRFMMDYEKTASDLIEKLHEKHESQMVEFAQKTQEELSSRMHFSKYIIELQTKQKYLVKLQKYEEASKIQKEIQQMKEQELQRQQIKNRDTLSIRCAGLHKQQVSAINSLLQNIQKDRNDQIKQRKQDSEKLMVRNKALLTQINHRHQEAIKRAYQILHNINVDERKNVERK